MNIKASAEKVNSTIIADLTTAEIKYFITCCTFTTTSDSSYLAAVMGQVETKVNTNNLEMIFFHYYSTCFIFILD